MRIDILTIFPRMFEGPFAESIVRRAINVGLLSIHVHDIRCWSRNRHSRIDDYPYGGGPGMVMAPEPLFASTEEVVELAEERGPIVLLSPTGRSFDHRLAAELSRLSRIILICGHYGGVDSRVHEQLVTDEISIGDYVLSGGELAAMVVVDAVVRQLPGALGNPQSASQDSFARGLLGPPSFTRPAVFRGWQVPQELLSGHHAKVGRWRRLQSLLLTVRRQPKLLNDLKLTEEEKDWLASNLSEG